MGDTDFRKLLRIGGIILKQGAFAIEDVREIQMLKKELDRQKDQEVWDYNSNKAIYDVSLAMKNLSRRSWEGKENIENFLTVLDAGVSCWKAYEDRKNKRGYKSDLKNLANRVMSKVEEYAESVGATSRVSNKEWRSREGRIVQFLRIKDWKIIIYDSARGRLAMKMPD